MAVGDAGAVVGYGDGEGLLVGVVFDGNVDGGGAGATCVLKGFGEDFLEGGGEDSGHAGDGARVDAGADGVEGGAHGCDSCGRCGAGEDRGVAGSGVGVRGGGGCARFVAGIGDKRSGDPGGRGMRWTVDAELALRALLSGLAG